MRPRSEGMRIMFVAIDARLESEGAMPPFPKEVVWETAESGDTP